MLISLGLPAREHATIAGGKEQGDVFHSANPQENLSATANERKN